MEIMSKIASSSHLSSSTLTTLPSFKRQTTWSPGEQRAIYKMAQYSLLRDWFAVEVHVDTFFNQMRYEQRLKFWYLGCRESRNVNASVLILCEFAQLFNCELKSFLIKLCVFIFDQ